MAKGKKKAGAKQAQNNAEDDDFLDALLDSKVEGGEAVEPDAEKKEESTATAADESEKKGKPAQDAAAAFLASQGLAPGDNEGDGEKKDNKKKKKKKKGGAGEPKAEEKVRI
jgi:hypothetical protein